MAIGTVGALIVTLEAQRLPVEVTSFTAVSDLDAYVIGAKHRRERLRQPHLNG